ncbi:alpha/beta fold hydrolase [Hugenholtzia roseola]|uniref:alpha/beta fold hydrolase n=1 Tax=Hugenholtzia roseola TaxID=1002 RepID=UPI000421AD5C|nr:alpha/beta fold hydrolase [Hugenholtzia roseola]
MSKKKWLWAISIGAVLANVVVYNQAYRFTHFKEKEDSDAPSRRKIESLDKLEKLKTALLGITLFKSRHPDLDQKEAKSYFIPTRAGKYRLAAWHFAAQKENAPLFLLFHGYGGNKSRLLPEARALQQMGYQVLAVDFVGHGNSEGTQVTLGYEEAKDVEAVFEWSNQIFNPSRLYFYGASMGAAAVLHAIARQEKGVKGMPSFEKLAGIVLECPFATMRHTVHNRFALMGLPAWLLPEWLMLWGSIQNGFWAFSHSPAEYAKSVQVPLLLLWGEQDERVKRSEIELIFGNIPTTTPKRLKTFPHCGHESYCEKEFEAWKEEMERFLEN